MPIVLDVLELATHDPQAVLRLTNIEKDPNSPQYGCELKIRSKGFGCDRPFWFDAYHLHEAIAALHRMASVDPGVAIIKSQWESEYIKFETIDRGHVYVSGQIEEHGEHDQRLSFCFRTDQTILPRLIRDLEQLRDA